MKLHRKIAKNAIFICDKYTTKIDFYKKNVHSY